MRGRAFDFNVGDLDFGDGGEHSFAPIVHERLKFAGLHEKEVRIIGKNRETLREVAIPERIQ
jgi:hypothetical protein